MSVTNSYNKAYSYNALIHKTPILKEKTACSSYSYAKEVMQSHPPIIMDEYGQTPDHYYLAKKAPPSFYQAKRKLNLQSLDSGADSSEGNQRRLRKKGNSDKLEAKTNDKPRYDTSLGQLTKKFLKLLADASDGVINLNTACSLLAVPKRRLYDITNVLEGAGLIQKTSRNNIQWMERVSSPCATVMKYDLEREIDILEAKENKLDELIYHMKCEINSVKEKEEQYLYVTPEDIQDIEDFGNKLVIGIDMPSGVKVTESTERTLLVSSEITEIKTHYIRNKNSTLNLTSIKQECIDADGACSVIIQKNNAANNTAKSESNKIGLSPDLLKMEENGYDPDIRVGSVWTECLEDDPAIKSAFILEEDDIAPIGKHFLLQTEDQDLDDFLPYSYLDNSIDAYSFSLDVGEGLTDLYDCGFP